MLLFHQTFSISCLCSKFQQISISLEPLFHLMFMVISVYFTLHHFFIIQFISVIQINKFQAPCVALSLGHYDLTDVKILSRVATCWEACKMLHDASELDAKLVPTRALRHQTRELTTLNSPVKVSKRSWYKKPVSPNLHYKYCVPLLSQTSLIPSNTSYPV